MEGDGVLVDREEEGFVFVGFDGAVSQACGVVESDG